VVWWLRDDVVAQLGMWWLSRLNARVTLECIAAVPGSILTSLTVSWGWGATGIMVVYVYYK
jgi:hypothetical protein